MIVHNVLFKLKNPDDVSEAAAVLRGMEGKIDVLRSIEVGIDKVGSERSYHIALVTRFDSWDDLNTYRDHPAHKPVLAHMANLVAQAAVVDYELS